MGRQLPVAEGQLIVSVSQVKTWLMCPRKYELRYVRGLPPAFVPVGLMVLLGLAGAGLVSVGIALRSLARRRDEEES